MCLVLNVNFIDTVNSLISIVGRWCFSSIKMNSLIFSALRRVEVTKSIKIVPKSSQRTAIHLRLSTHTPSGGIAPEPEKTPFGLLGIVCAVIPGLLIGATISKYMANFLEENELFIPDDDDDDDDD